MDTMGTMEVFSYFGASILGKERAQLYLSFPQVPLKVFPQLLLSLQLWVMWQVPGQVLILIINILVLIQVHVPQPVPLPLALQEE